MSKDTKKRAINRRMERAAWWETHGDSIAGAFENALSGGYSGPCTVVVTGDSTVPRFRLGSKDVAKVRVQAAARGLRHDAYLKIVVHEALSKNEQKDSSGV